MGPEQRRRHRSSRSGLVAATLFCATLPLVSTGSAVGSPGDLDPAFGSGGKRTLLVGVDSGAYASALQHDGKIVLGGWSKAGSTAPTRFALVRFTKRGSLDRGFGSRGWLTSSIGAGSSIFALAVERGGKIVAGGTAQENQRSAFTLARYRLNGSLDISFGVGGTVRTEIGASSGARALATQVDGKIIAGGGFTDDLNRGGFALVRYRTNGSLDPTFGTGGVATTEIGGDRDVITGLAIQPDGKIIAVGSSRCGHYCSKFALARYTSYGSLDSTFGSGGTVTTAIQGSDAAAAVARQHDGKIVVAGTSSRILGAPSFAVARFTDEGSLDTTFGGDGMVTTLVGTASEAAGLAIRGDGKIVVGGDGGSPTKLEFAVVRYRQNGSVDRSFGAKGTTTTSVDRGQTYAYALAQQRDGRIVMSGRAYNPSTQTSKFAIARFLDTQAVCLVPDLRRKSFLGAKRMLRRNHCSVGRVKYVRSGKVRKGRVISQRPARGTRASSGAKVSLVLSQGK